MVLPVRFGNGFALQDGNAMDRALARPMWETKIGITALAGGARTGAPVLSRGINVIATVATGADSVVLPVLSPGDVVFVKNSSGGNSAQVFAQGTDTIDGTAGATGISLANGKGQLFFASDVGKWVTLLGA